MEWSDTLQSLLLLGGGAVALKILEYVWAIVNKSLGRRRNELDRLGSDFALAIVERDRQTYLKRKALEMVYVLRAMMIQSGHWKQSDLPDPPEE